MIEPWLPTLQTFSKVWVGFSGGLDSAVLMHILAAHQLDLPPIEAIHINHDISANADSWQSQAAIFCKQLAIPFSCQRVNFDKSSNVEEGARTARYAVFASYLQAGEVLLLAHHADDQAETLLLQLFRGAGINGLAAMPEIASFASGTLLRPLLGYQRKELQAYAEAENLDWVEDESNFDEKYSRNYLRHSLIPTLEQKWPGLVNNINRAAKHCQDALVNLDALAAIDIASANQDVNVLSIQVLDSLTKPRIINVLRYWFKKNCLRAVSTVMITRIYKEFFRSRSDANPEIRLENYLLRRYQDKLYLVENQFSVLPKSTSCEDNTALLNLSQLLGYDVAALLKESGLVIGQYSIAEIRFRQGGELFFWHGQHKDVKKLMQQWKIPPWLRNRIPLLYIDNELIALLGYAVRKVEQP